MKITKESRPEADIITISGKLDSTTATELDARLREDISEDSGRPVILDFSGVLTLTSAPLRAILSLAKRMQRHSAMLFVAAPSEAAQESLRISGFLKLRIFEVMDSVGSALAKIERAPIRPAGRAMPGVTAPRLPGLVPAIKLTPLAPQNPPVPPSEKTEASAPLPAAKSKTEPAPPAPVPEEKKPLLPAQEAAPPASGPPSSSASPVPPATEPELPPLPPLPEPKPLAAGVAAEAAPVMPIPMEDLPPLPVHVADDGAEPPPPPLLEPELPALPEPKPFAAGAPLLSRGEELPPLPPPSAPEPSPEAAKTPALSATEKSPPLPVSAAPPSAPPSAALHPQSAILPAAAPVLSPPPVPAAAAAPVLAAPIPPLPVAPAAIVSPAPPPASPAPEREPGVMGWFNHWAGQVQDALDYWMSVFKRK